MIPGRRSARALGIELARRVETLGSRMAPGSLGGTVRSASPVSPIARGASLPVPRPAEEAGGGAAATIDHLWVVRHTQQTIPGTGATTDIAFTEVYQSGGSAISWAIGTPEAVTLNEDGIYDVTGYIPWAVGGAAPVGKLSAMLWDFLGTFDVNDSTTVSGAAHVGEHFTGVSHVGFLPAGTELHLGATQDTGADQTASQGGSSGTGYGASLKVALLGPSS